MDADPGCAEFPYRTADELRREVAELRRRRDERERREGDAREQAGIAAIDGAADATTDLAGAFVGAVRIGGSIGEAFRLASEAARQLAEHFHTLADIYRERHAAEQRARSGQLPADFLADIIGDEAARQHARQLTLADVGVPLALDRSDPYPGQHQHDCPAIGSKRPRPRCTKGCPDGQRWNAEHDRRRDAAPAHPFGRDTDH